jgi:hypothetical protein
VFADCETQPEATMFAGHRPFRSPELVKNMLLFVCRDARAGVLHLDDDQRRTTNDERLAHAIIVVCWSLVVGRWSLVGVDPHGDAALLGKLDGVAHQVQNDLAQSRAISEDVWPGLWQIGAPRKPFIARHTLARHSHHA